ncbi:MAG: DUF3298 domain-containing protein [Lachnospiraceae bacterium]|nr:DUF3298 domain-containing protein [Lachnospiraceae bacterium]
MTEWEQIKKEYREIPVPTNGPHQMLRTIADAKRKRDRWKRITKYGSMVAAAMLVVLILPGIWLFSGGFGGSEDMAALESAVSNEESAESNGWFKMDSAKTEDATENKIKVPAMSADNNRVESAEENSDSYAPKVENDAANAAYGTNAGSDNAENTADFLPTPSVEQGNLKQSTGNLRQEEELSSFPVDAISKEILRQMEERMLETEETYYIKSATYPNGFESITAEQTYYINGDGLYVIQFEAGEVAPKEQGVIEFVIPAEVAAP